MNNIYELHLLDNAPQPIIFRQFFARLPEEPAYVNWHRNIEILLFLKGSATLNCTNVNYDVSGGDMFIVNSSCTHYINAKESLDYQCLIIDYTFLEANGIYVDKITFSSLIHDDDYMRNLFTQIAEEFFSSHPYRSFALRAKVLTLMLHLMRNYLLNPSEVQSAPAKTEGIKIAISYILSHLNSKMSIDDIALQSGLNKYYLIHKFKEQTGYTPIEYINVMRCENAKQMLSLKIYTIDEIAATVGFKTTSYFSQTFKKYVGCSPSEYTKKQ